MIMVFSVLIDEKGVEDLGYGISSPEEN